MIQQATLGRAATILASVGLLSAAAIAQDGSSLSSERLDRVADMPGIGGAAAGRWYAPVDFEGELRGVLFDDQMEPAYEIEAMMTQIIVALDQEVPDLPAELMEGFLYGDVYRVATDQGPRELVGRLEGSWQGNQHGAGQFLALMYHLRLTQEVAGIIEGEFRGAFGVDGTPIDDGGCSDVTACIAKHEHDGSRRTARKKSFSETGAPLPQVATALRVDRAQLLRLPQGAQSSAVQVDAQKAVGHSGVPVDSSSKVQTRRQRDERLIDVPDNSQGASWTGSQIGGMSGFGGPTPLSPPLDIDGMSAAVASLVPEPVQPGRFHGRWKLFL